MRTTLTAAVLSAALLLAGCGEDASTAAGVRTVSAQDAVAVIQQDDAVVIDVRTPEEYAEGHLASARNVPLAGDFEADVSRLPRDATYVLYCRTGNRSAQAAEVMERLGFTDVRDAGGLPGLAAAGAEVVAG